MPTIAPPDGASILMVIDSVYPSTGGGGAENQLRTLAKSLKQRGFDVEIWAPLVKEARGMAQHDLVDGIVVHRLYYPQVRLLGGVWLLVAIGLRLLAHGKRFDIIHAHIAGKLAATCSLLGWVLHKPVLVKLTGLTEMVGGILDPHPPLSARLQRRLLKFTSLFQAISSRIAMGLVDVGYSPAQVMQLPNAVDIRRFRPVTIDSGAAARLYGHKTLVGIFTGRLRPDKNIDLLIRSWARCFADRNDTALIIVGHGTLEAVLREQALQLGVANQVLFVGPSDQVEKYYALAHFGILTSQMEGLSNTLLEFMACGLPVIGTRVSGNEDFITDGQTGWLFDVGHTTDFEACLHRMSACAPEERALMGQAARRRVVETASLDVVLDRLIDSYHTLGAPVQGLDTT
ncbi:MAG: glycosyltransferase family 4 protein [Burkholderiales bacterium]